MTTSLFLDTRLLIDYLLPWEPFLIYGQAAGCVGDTGFRRAFPYRLSGEMNRLQLVSWAQNQK